MHAPQRSSCAPFSPSRLHAISQDDRVVSRHRRLPNQAVMIRAFMLGVLMCSGGCSMESERSCGCGDSLEAFCRFVDAAGRDLKPYGRVCADNASPVKSNLYDIVLIRYNG